MSLTFKSFGSIVNADDLKKTVLGLRKQEDWSNFGDDPWNWPEEKPEAVDDSPSEVTWLNECKVAISPYGDTLAVAHEKVLLIFTAKWDSQEEGDNKIKFLLKWQGDPRNEHTEHITCVQCLPIAAQGRVSSSHSSPDWTCVAVGFDSGSVSFFTESGSLLLTEKFHFGPVRSVRVQTYLPGTEIQDELHVVYRSTVCTVQGIVLSNTLKACRNQLAKVLANMEREFDVVSLGCSKWEVGEQAVVSDAWSLGPRSPSFLSNLVSASVEGGFSASFSPLPPTRSDVIATGARPYVGLHSIKETSPQPVLSDVARAVASKLKSTIGQAIPGWLGGRKDSVSERTRHQPAMDPVEPMTCRFGVVDLQRKGERMVCCPYKKLCAVMDSFGRVVLVDTYSGIALRMWKGHRDAECAFVPVLEDRTGRRKAMFLTIYAPKKGILEIWALQYGPKVATFQVPKNGRLLYTNHGLTGVSQNTFKGTNLGQFPCVFIDENGILRHISIPFHIILSTINNKKAKDAYLLKQIKRLFGKEGCEKEISTLLRQISSADTVKQVLDLVVKSKYTTLSFIKLIISVICSRFSSKEGEEVGKVEQQCLGSCANLDRLLVIYEFFVNLRQEPASLQCPGPSSPATDNQEVCRLLRISEKECESLMECLSLGGEAKVQFDTCRDLLPAVLACFHDTYPLYLPLSVDTTNTHHITLFGELVCQGVLEGTCSVDKWKSLIDDLIQPQHLLHMVLVYWLSKSHCRNLHDQIINFSLLINSIINMSDPKIITLWWADVRNVISCAENTAASLSAVYVFRAISVADEERLFDKGDGDWVAISEESCAWTQTIAQLEAIILLQSAIRYKNKNADCSNVPCLEVCLPQLTLSEFLSRGPGLVSEVVAQWVGSWGLAVEWLCESGLCVRPPASPDVPRGSHVVEGCAEPAAPARPALPSTSTQETVLSLLTDLVSRFPYTLSVDSLVCNLAWEYSLAWTKHKPSVYFLDYALRAVQAVSDPSIQHGLCCLMWSTHLCCGFEGSVRLLEKVGKLPKERLCLQEVGLPDSSLPRLLSVLASFLETFLQSVTRVEQEEGRGEVGVEEVWAWSQYPPSLVQVCVTKRCTNSALLEAKLSCAKALLVLTSAQLRLHRPVTTLFHSLGEVILESDILNQAKVPECGPNPKMNEARLSFLKKVLSSVIERLPNSPEEADLKDMMQWVSKALDLCSDWELSPDELRRHHIALLYYFNHDKLAQEMMSYVMERDKLGRELLVVAGRRLHTIISSDSPQVKEVMANLSPSLTNWVQNQEVCKLSPSLEQVKEMSLIVLNLLPESNTDYKLANLLFESLQVF